MLSRLTLRSIGPHRGAGRARFARAALVPLLASLFAAVLTAYASTADAGPGSGSAQITQPDSAVAGSKHQWTILYDPSEDFGNPQGGVIEVRIPNGWTPPQRTSSGAPGYVDYTNPTVVTSISISGQSIRLILGAGPPATKKFLASDLISVLYGVGGPSSLAVTDTVAKIDSFLVSSDPQNTGTLSPLAAGSPRVRVLPDTVSTIRIADGAGIEVGSFARTTDQDTTHFYLRGYDRFGNFARFVNGAWRATGAIGFLTDSTLLSRRLVVNRPGTGKIYADSAAWHDSTGAVLAFHGAYAGLASATPASATAGSPFAASAESRDADGNRITDDVGSAQPIRFVGHADSLGASLADPLFVNPNATLAAGTWSGALTARRSGTYFIAARDTLTGRESSPRLRLTVAPSVPDRIELRPDTLRLAAGVPDTVTILARDVFGNRAPFTAPEEVALWTDRPQGRFEDSGGNAIFSATIPAGRDSVDVRYRDTQSTVAAGRIRAIDANGVAPFVGFAEAAVLTSPAVPSGSVALAAAPDTLVAGSADSARVVSSVVRDAYGNAVAVGERFTVTAVGVSVITDVDPGTPGVQWAVAAGSTVSGWVRAGTAAGAASVVMASEQGNASGTAGLTLVAGSPAGTIALAANPDSVAADGLAVRSISAPGLHDAFANPVADGEPYTVATTLGSIASPDADAGTPGVQVRASGGAIAFDLSGGAVLGTAVVSAASVRGTSSGSVGVRLVPGAVSAESSSVAATSPVAVGAPGSVVTVTLRDRRGHALSGVPSDSIAVAASGVAVVATPLAGATDAAGAIAYGATATAAGSAGLSVVARGVPLAATPSIQFTHGALDTLVVTGPSGPLTAGAPDSLRVAARDRFGNAMPDRNDLVRASVLSGGAAGLPVSVTLSGGSATIPFTPTLAAPLLIAVADDSSHATSFGPVGVTAGAPYRIAADPPAADTLPAGGSTLVRARLFDAFGNPAPGGTVVASVVAGAGSVAPPSAVADGSGGADVTLGAGPVPGVVILRLAAAGSPAPDPVRSDSVSVVVIPAPAASVAITAAGSVRAGDSLDVAITLRDAFGNVAVGATPTLQLDTSASLPDSVSWSPGQGALGFLADNPADDRATYAFAAADSGTVVLRARFTRAETLRVSVSGVGSPVSSADVVVTPAPAATLAAAGGDAQTAIVGRVLAQPPRVVARDAFGNPVPGAAVSFRVRAGGGTLDAVSGAPADSDVVTDATGAARCDVVRLGTVAGSGNNRIAASLPFPGDSVIFTASALPDTAAALALAPASLSLGPGGTAAVTATARDAFGNAVPGAALTLYLGSSPAGALESLGQSSGTGTTQAGASDAAGQLSVRYRAPTAAPATDVVYARGPSVGPVSILVTVAPSTVDSLVVLPDAASWTAGSPMRVRVRALDASGNPALGDTATIVMGATGAASFAPAFGALSGGEFTTFASATTAGALQVTARTASGGGTFASGPVTVGPAAPAGAIPIAAARDTLTADGRSTTTVVFGPLHDAFGNTAAPGTLVTVAADSLVAPDASPAAGLQISTGADDLARALLVAPRTPGSGTIRAASVLGGARDSLAVVYLPPPSLAFAGTLAPLVAAPGQTVSFAVDVRNAAATGSVTLGTASVFSFGGGAGAFAVNPASPVTIPAGATRTLAMNAAAISSGLQPGTYAPSLRLVGSDATGDPLDFYLSLAGVQVHVAGIQVAAVGASPDPAPLGAPALALTFRVDNLAAAAATVDAVALTPSTFAVTAVSPPLPAALGPLGSTTLTLTVSVPASGIPDGAEIASDLAASVSFGSVVVQSVTQSPLRFHVVSGATLAAQSSGTAPARYLRGRTFAPAARLANGGSASITLSPGSTRLVLQRGAARLEARLAAATAVPGSGAADLAFDSLAVPAGAALGRYAASLLLAGTESGQAFADTIPLAPDSVDVMEPALLTAAGALVPDRVSAGQTRPVQVTIANAGDVPFVLDASTRLVLGAPLFTRLTPTATGSIPARGSLLVTFGAAPLGTPSSSPGPVAALVEAHGAEDGRARDEAVDAGSLAVEAPARIAYVGGSAAPDTVRAGQTVSLTLAIRNDGGSPLLVDPAATGLLVTDGVESARAFAAGSPFPLAPGAAASLAFPSVPFPASLASQAYPVALTVHGTEWGLAESTVVVSPSGELSVVEPVAALQVRGLPAGAPVQAAAEDGPLRLWSLELTPLIPAGGASSSHLRSVSFTVVIDGASAAGAAAAVDQITLRDDQGTILAQAAPGAPGKVVLTLAAPLAITGPAVVLSVEVALQAGTAARSVALRLADPADIEVRDDLTQAPVSVRAAGGLPFEPLTSPAVTLFAKPHGYPNPFRAGREAIRLSYRLAADAPVRVAIYTLFGDLVREIALAAGVPGGERGLNEVPWDGRNGAGETVRPGAYVARIEGGGVSEAIKVGVLR